MFLFPALNFLLALVFVYLLLSVVVSNLNELRVSIRNIRGKRLYLAIDEVFDDSRLNKNYAYLLYIHPFVNRMKQTQKRKPSYLSASIFAQALIDIIGDNSVVVNFQPTDEDNTRLFMVENRKNDMFERFKIGVEKLNYSNLKILLRLFVDNSTDLYSLQRAIEQWYNDYMDRVTGWYKRSMQLWLFSIGLLVAVGLNVDTIYLTRQLWQNESMRIRISQGAMEYIEKKTGLSQTPPAAEIDYTYQQIQALQLPIGWNATEPFSISSLSKQIIQTGGSVQKIIGWLLTGFIVSFGAPFWFDILKRFVNVRNEGIRPLTSTANT